MFVIIELLVLSTTTLFTGILYYLDANDRLPFSTEI